ncbi:WecB/TagA/CpsF family glycosyltransferase [Bacillus circulans]|jgi:N-acetylglucosaminyldiphosphoundecaprenol N-acetyl-beta-D-mannosaminyltransferase|uniref:WecB/TagA/CpsF family glycosyltransferase n=1 Tax=Niallia TaxID=2837506 RepID=UPI0014904F07|nr:WecB/TagA/CpsF family glycosyltransferase [Niallia circulans]NRG29455.1 WecB/TagA/CpsF family glycosyltransferase [Niallia circulans]QJX63831.1 WecB/TagA/CpsF family glycosyltransferase [Niallia circulans]
MDKKWLGNLKVNVISSKEAIKYIKEKLDKRIATDVFFLNDHGYNIAQKDTEYREMLNNADLLLNDGIGIEMGAKLFGFSFKENLNGTDFIPALFASLNEEKRNQPYRVFLLGAKPGVAQKAQERLQQTYQNILFVGNQDGYFPKENTENIISQINESKADILLVGFGMPLQEQWINEYRSKLESTITMAVGAFIDFSSGEVTRAPKIFRDLRLEWLYRMGKEPRRLWKRNVVGHASFFYSIYKQRKTN